LNVASFEKAVLAATQNAQYKTYGIFCAVKTTAENFQQADSGDSHLFFICEAADLCDFELNAGVFKRKYPLKIKENRAF